jgi:hypothetical protein
MKTSLTLLTLLFFVSLFTIGSADNDAVVGSWEFSNPQVPWEFNKGFINFMEAEDEVFSGEIEFHTGQKVPMNKVDIDGTFVSFGMDIAGSVVNADCMVEGDTMTCDLTTMQGPMQITATKVTEEQE